MRTEQQAMKIYKYNPLIRGKIIGKLTNYDFFLYEVLFRELQREVRQQCYFEFLNITLHIHMPRLKELLYQNGDKVPKNWRDDVKQSLTRLRALTIELQNYEVPDESYLKEESNILTITSDVKLLRKIEYASFGMLENPEIIDNTLYWTFSKYMYFWAWYKKNYTHLDLSALYLLNSKYAQRMYEYLTLCQSINKAHNNEFDTISINKEDFENIIGIKNSSVAVLFQKIHLNSVVLPELRKIYPNIEIVSPKRMNFIDIKL